MAASDDNVSVSSLIEHEFSSPWEDSDLVLVVEDQQLHVHRFILKMASPVFKAMLLSDFKEKEAAEIPLPGKNADDFVALLKQIYPQFTRDSITLTNVEHIYQLADEYQINSVAVACQEFLESLEKPEIDAMKILLKAQICEANEARRQCYDILQQCSTDELENDDLFEKLDGPSTRGILLLKVKRLEQCLKDVQPQIWGLIDHCLYLSSNPEKIKKEAPHECAMHMNTSLNSYYSSEQLIRCLPCKTRLTQMVLQSQALHDRQGYFAHCRNITLGHNIVKALEDIPRLLKT